LRATSLDTRNLWSQRPSVHLHEGLLVRSPPEGHCLQLIPPQVIRKKLFEHAHAGPLRPPWARKGSASAKAELLLARGTEGRGPVVP